jgi:hypothetical protein
MAYTNIDDPSAYFQTLTYTGNGSNPRNLTNDGNSDLKPDFIWTKNRTDGGTDHVVTNSSFGFDAPNATFEGGAGSDETLNGQLSPNSTAKQNNPAATYGYISGHLTDGFTAAAGGTNGDVANANAKNFVAWQWKANGGTTSTNTEGDINSTVQVNQDAGFSVVMYEPTDTTSRNIGHGLGTTPGLIIIRNRKRIENWRVWHQSMGAGGYSLDSAAAYNTSTSTLINTVNSTIFNVGTDFSVNGAFPYAAWCWVEKQGYSKFGKYIGNGVNNAGPFVYTGFKPALIMIKSTTATGATYLWDTKRNPFNGADDTLNAAEADAETSNGIMTVDILSNGFKIKNTGANNGTNQSGTTYIFMAWAEHPFVTSTGVPTTAR